MSENTVKWVHTLVIGSGASGLNAAVQLRAGGIEDVVLVTEGLQMGTSINTGSDKQTYYKLGMYGEDADAPVLMAESSATTSTSCSTSSPSRSSTSQARMNVRRA